MYHAIMDTLNADLLQCLLAQIELTQGKATSGKKRLLTVLSIWQPTLQADPREHPARRAPRANIISAAACYLAGIECQAHDLQRSLAYIDIAIQAGLESYKVRQAEAFMMKGQILEAQNGRGKANALDPMIEESYKQAIHVLKDTGRTGTLSQAHYEFGRYLLSIGRHEQGNQEMEIARVLVGIPSIFNAR
jgi:tetratricopeptide (TPR) repeat protein